MMIWIFLPAYNEEASLVKLLPKIKEKLESKAQPYHIVVVNDGSVDRTQLILEEQSKTLPLTIISHPINRGLGETERDGFEHIARHCDNGDVVVRLDCDDTHEPDYIFDLSKKLEEGFDVVNTSRFRPGGGQMGVSAYRATISRIANVFTWLVFQISGVRDYSCGYRAYKAQVVKDAVDVFGNNFIQLRGLGFTSTLEMIVKLHLLGCRFAEVPFILRYDQKQSDSKMVSSITSLGYMIMSVLYWWPFGGWRNQYKGLRSLYRTSREEAVSRFNCRTGHRSVLNRMGF